jgi:hypothetical protein
MSQQQTTFANIANDTVFIYNGIDYKKMPEVRVSCCRKLNAVMINNGEKVFVPDNATITIK